MGMHDMREIIKNVPIVGAVARRIYRALGARKDASEPFPGSAAYWEKRYSAGGNSGVGSYARFAEFKADILNAFVAKHGVKSVIEFGCGDGNQLTLAEYPSYLGVDVSRTALDKCKALFKSDAHKSFLLMSEYNGELADLALSLDVIYHLVEDDVYENHMRTLFQASNRFVIIYASDSEDEQRSDGTHVRHRKFTQWIRTNVANWKLMEHVPNRYPYRGDYRTGSFSDFFIYEKT